eukprot:CAMPEP_0194136194 /NCGR_PEP_ID=MMETSP0152-20130528/6219_1 /TAXON_ID=1049557 /ORGANISM="Thalassiothrix antarctica, Strain L6-D1" /LENGTH=922 /DNA_ID=CAMNT_0038832747 /DNA_START=183 /DNA_END=2951 /DNA_ORIENTATION=+
MSSDGYGSISRDESETAALIAPTTADGDAKGSGVCSRRNLILGTLLAILVVVIGGRAIFRNSSNSSSKTSFQISPIDDMGMLSVQRNDDALPSSVWGNHLHQEGHPLPTNSWYLNLVSHRAAYKPDDQTRVYTVPYIIDTASPYPGMEGLRVHWPIVQASDRTVQMVDDYKNVLCLGAEGFVGSDSDDTGIDGSYKVKDGPLSPLGVGLEWGDSTMSTNIIRGMPYASMEYNNTAVPTIYSYNGLSSDIQIDRDSPFEPETSEQPKVVCGENVVSVERHLHLHIEGSDFTWMVFFSKPVKVSCTTPNGETNPLLQDFKLSVLENDDEDEESSSLVIRVALMNQCTTGHSTIQEHCMEKNAQPDQEGYERLLKAHAHVLPNSPTIDFEYSTTSDVNDNDDVAKIHIDWDATSTLDSSEELLMFGLPHHLESLSASGESNTTDFCVNSFHGHTCLVASSKWTLEESLGAPLSFLAPRPPKADLVPVIAEYLSDDILFQLADNTLRGASDTYFSGKLLARLARVLVIATELDSLAEASSAEDVRDYYGDATTEMLEDSIAAASKVNLPSSEKFDAALDQLTKAVTVWLKSDAEAPYIYDESWGGLINCGCIYVGKGDRGHCNNTFPDCPALASVNEDFGNGYYNDHHYHYGYHVYAAAVVAKLDPSWGREHFDEVLLYIRDFANPSEDDEFFPQYRQKDWFLGSSWASGIVSAENSPHGRNEESSSEAISAYEGVTLFGSAMVDAFEEVFHDNQRSLASKLETALLIRDSGQLLAASEIHATNRYWHIWSSDTHNSTYPPEYQQPVVGMLYDTMATFQTWFSSWAVVSYGIQLIPLTPVAETRDDIDWATELYPKYEKACADTGDFCEDNGWSILQAGLLATTGNYTDAVKQAMAVPEEVFATDGGLGNSMSNTIWYIATRKNPE